MRERIGSNGTGKPIEARKRDMFTTSYKGMLVMTIGNANSNGPIELETIIGKVGRWMGEYVLIPPVLLLSCFKASHRYSVSRRYGFDAKKEEYNAV